ncbi:PilZ domain-containing protein [Bacillus tianshenii]|nr:PilZ domain-containing protein [Bacillus tianshenii]
MMIYRRDEAFRYEFGTPLDCKFSIIQINDKPYNSKQGAGKIHDISPRGLKIKAPLDLNAKQNEVKIEIHFELMKRDFSIEGTVLWQEKFIDTFIYGIELDIFDDTQELLIRQIKLHASASIDGAK